MLSGISGSTAGLRIPWGPSNGTRWPSCVKPAWRIPHGSTSPWIATCSSRNEKAASRTAESSATVQFYRIRQPPS